MKYFFTNLGAHVVLCVILIILMSIFTNRNFKRKTKHVLTYFFPVVLLLIFGFDVVRYLAPRLFDIDNVLNNVTYTHTGVVEEVSSLKNYIRVDGVNYYINPMRNKVKVGSTVKIKYTPSANYIMNVSGDVDSSDG